jgi:hypothetical protein
MSVAAILPPRVSKEIRALLPVWALAMAGLSASFVLWNVVALGFIAYGVGVLALGAQSVGQEYGYGTLPMLLSQPIDRRRLLAIKAAVLAPMLLTVLALASVVFRDAYGHDYAGASELAVLFLPVLCALLLTPWLTMLSRSPLGGVVFSIGLSGAILTISRVSAGWLGTSSDAGIGALLVAWTVAGVFGWQRFMRLEAIDGTSSALDFPRLLPAVRRRHPLWMLMLKELRLQQLTFALVAVYLVGWASLSVVERFDARAVEIPLDVLTPLYLVLLTLLIGALASAEERQYGTISWQQLLPVRASRQWMVKVTVVFGLAALFGIALPWLLGRVSGAFTGRVESFRTDLALLVVVSTALSLYLSSLCRSGVHAAVFSIVLVPVALSVGIPVARDLIESWLRAAGNVSWMADRSFSAWQFVERSSISALAVFVVAVLVRLAYLNHRSAEWTRTDLLRQLLLIVVSLAVGSAVITSAFMVIAPR